MNVTNDKRVLIIIPTYNRASFLEEAVESVLSQDYPHKRIFIVDDGSTDNTSSICENYTLRYPDIIQYFKKVNAGCASARNYGLDRMGGDIGYVCFLDSDDKLLPGKLSREIKLLENNPDADFVYSNYILYDDDAKQESFREVAAAGKPENFAIEHFLTNEAKSSAMLYRVQVVSKRRFREDLRLNEDSEFVQRIAIECKGIYLHEPSAWIRWHKNSKSRSAIEILQAVIRSNFGIINDFPVFYRSIKKEADGRLEELRRLLLLKLVMCNRWTDADQYSKTLFEKITVFLKLKFLLWIKIFLIKVSSCGATLLKRYF